MNVVLPIDTVQQYCFIQRTTPLEDTLDLVLHNKGTGVDTTTSSFITPSKGHYKGLITHDFQEGESYSYTLSDSANIVARGLIYVTAQTPQDYEIDQGLYTYSNV